MELYRLIQLCKLNSTMPHLFQTKIVFLNTHFSEKKCSIWHISFSSLKYALCYNKNMGIKR